jgi:pyridoxal phosphate enzyme (YggS family)
MSVAQNIQRIRQELPPHVRLVAVSKTHSAAAVMEAYRTGQRDFGESKPQELLQKVEALPKDIRWHFIGHLQTNKVKMVAPHAHLIHSIDSERLLHEVNKFCEKAGTSARCLLQVHVAQEESKFGFSPAELVDLLQSQRLRSCPRITVAGLMGMATYTDNREQVRGEFRQLHALFEQAKALLPHPEAFTEISMGMSHDYPLAIGEGATLLRIGTSIFGGR